MTIKDAQIILKKTITQTIKSPPTLSTLKPRLIRFRTSQRPHKLAIAVADDVKLAMQRRIKIYLISALASYKFYTRSPYNVFIVAVKGIFYRFQHYFLFLSCYLKLAQFIYNSPCLFNRRIIIIFIISHYTDSISNAGAVTDFHLFRKEGKLSATPFPSPYPFFLSFRSNHDGFDTISQ